MKVFRLSLLAALALATTLATTGCKSSGTAFNPPGGLGALAIKHMYLSMLGGGATVIEAFTVPVTATSTPSVTLSAQNPGFLFVDSRGRLYVPDFGRDNTVYVYDLPLTDSSTPAFSLTTSETYPEATAEDASGNIYVSDQHADVSAAAYSGYVDVYDGPVSASASPSYTIPNNVGAGGLASPADIAFGPNGDLYTSDEEDVDQFSPPFSTSSVPSAGVTPNGNNFGLRVDSKGRVFVANATSDGVVNVYASPLTNSSTPTFGITFSAGTIVLGLAFDGSGSLWAVDADGNVWKVAEPITASSTPTMILTGVSDVYGIAFGP